MSDCTGSQFEIIAKAKQALFDSTNIDTSPDEMACLNDFLFRCWQMGWLDKYDDTKDVVEVVRCKDCKYHDVNWDSCTRWTSDQFNQASVRDNDYCSCGERKDNE